jgi:hypothetical protein
MPCQNPRNQPPNNRATEEFTMENLNLGNGLEAGLESIAFHAGVPTVDVLRAAVFCFTNHGADEFMENPQSLNFRFFSDEEEEMLRGSGHHRIVDCAGILAGDDQAIAEQVVIDCAVERLLQVSL